MDLIHYSRPYRLIANKATAVIQEVAESCGESIEFAESESTGVTPYEYFSEEIVRPVREMMQDCSNEEVVASCERVIDFVSSELTSVTENVSVLYNEYKAIVSEIVEKGEGKSSLSGKILVFYSEEGASALGFNGNCREITRALLDWIEDVDDSEEQIQVRSYVKKLDDYLLGG